MLLALAALYRHSKVGREGTVGDFIADFRSLLSAAASTDGDARVRAAEDLRCAEHESGGLLTLDRHPRDPNIIYKVRLRPAGEDWLFQRLGQRPTGAQRSELAAWFREQAAANSVQFVLPDRQTGFQPVMEDSASCLSANATTGRKPIGHDSQDACPSVKSAASRAGGAPHPGWPAWLLDLAERAQAGKSVLPFERDNAAFNVELLRTIAAVLTWPEESLMRYASAVICGDSKRLQVLEARLLQGLRAITADPAASLETFGILQTPRAVLLHGPLQLDLPGGTLDLGLLCGPVAISASDLEAATSLRCSASACLTVENESVFRELAKRNPGILLLHTSFPGAATRRLLSLLPATLSCHHFGDTDPAGFDILRDLRARSGRAFQPIGMEFRPDPAAPGLTDLERRVVHRLLASLVLADVHAELQAMLEHGTKGAFEQESLGQAGLRRVAAHFLPGGS